MPVMCEKGGFIHKMDNNNNIVATENVSELRKLRKKRRRTNGLALGIMVNIFAILGVISLVIIIIQSTVSLFNNTREKTKLEEYLLPAVMNDITTFENVSAISDRELKMIALWGIFVNNDLSAKYKMDDQDYVIIPAAEFEMEIQKMFGPDVTINHGTFNQEGDFISTFIYDPEINSYRVNPRPRHDVYSPKVIEIKKVDNEMSVLVGLIPPEGFLGKNVRGPNYQPEPEQYREFIILTHGGDMQITKVIDRPDLHPAVQAMEQNSAATQPSVPAVPSEDITTPSEDVNVG